MNTQEKEQISVEARERLTRVQDHIDSSVASMREDVTNRRVGLKSYEAEVEEAAMLEHATLRYLDRRMDELEKLRPSPYFQRLDLRFSSQEQTVAYFLGKFAFPEEKIVSWFSPLASIRFEEPGTATYHNQEDEMQSVEIQRKDQYMITDGKIIFLATESVDHPRELVYQDYFNSRRQGFQLPEIVAQMEKAQDQVIRAHHIGPFQISGPAGSGKTTLALHRVAYLTQSPDTERLFPADSILVLVQDTGTQDYFSHLLPELGIDNVAIRTFPSWAFGLLGLEGYMYEGRIGSHEQQRDQYEYQKIQAMRSMPASIWRTGGPYAFLEKIYSGFLHTDDLALFQQQKDQQTLDRFDLTLLMEGRRQIRDSFQVTETQRVRQKNGIWKDKKTVSPLQYSLILVDEFQNYLPEQLTLFRHFSKPRTQAILYVGDLAQQTQLGAAHRAEDLETSGLFHRSVRLQKVYRNTKKILEYIRQVGFEVEIPEGLKEGVSVEEISVDNAEDELTRVLEIVRECEGQVGVLAFDQDYIERYREAFTRDERVHCLSVREAQGVEFETVCLVGMRREMFDGSDAVVEGLGLGHDFVISQRRIQRDLLYVAFTRAISRLVVLGDGGLEGIARE